MIKVLLQSIDAKDIYRLMSKELPKVASKRYGKMRKGMKGLEYERMLQTVGLAPYSRTKNALGGVAVFFLGCIAGGIAALALTPVSGTQLRTQVKDKARNLIPQGEMGMKETPAQA